MEEFQRGRLGLKDADLDVPLREVRALLDADHDGQLTLAEVKAAQRDHDTIRQLSRVILRYPSEWKADKKAWDAYDALIPPSSKTAWEAEKARIAQLVWWDQVAGKVKGFPVKPFVFHIHPVAMACSFSGYAASRLSRKGFWFIYSQEARENVSNVLHWPGGDSGVTLGPGYDMGERSAPSIRGQMLKIGLSEAVATGISGAAGLTGAAAKKFASENKGLVRLDRQQEAELLRVVVPAYEKIVIRDIDRVLTQNEFDALTSFAYNPAGRWRSLATLINAGDLSSAVRKIREGASSGGVVLGGLVKRREDEVNLLIDGRYEFQGEAISIPYF